MGHDFTMKQGNQPKRRPWRRRLVLGLCMILAFVVVLLWAAWWTMIRMPGSSYRGEPPAIDEKLKRLADELRDDVARLAVEIGERNVIHPKQLDQAADYIETKFQQSGYQVKRQEYEVSRCKCANLHIEMPGNVRGKEIIVVGAHYDTVYGTPGADDNTSGVAATLALARRFARSKPQRTLRFVAFVNEEPPNFQTERMGSLVYARRCRELGENIVGMLSLEMLGYYTDAPNSQRYPIPFSLLYPSEGNFIAFIGNTSSGKLVREVVGTFRRSEQFPSEGAAAPGLIRGVGFSDHWSFWQAGYPALMVTDTAMFRYRYYHEAEDTIDKLDFVRMARVVRGLEKVVAELIGVD